MNPLEEFWSLCNQAEDAYSSDESIGTPELEPFCLRILRLVDAHPELRVEFETVFCELGHHKPWEIVMFCMHNLRWPKVQEYYERELHNAISCQDWRAYPVMRDILASFRDDWEDRELFRSFGKKLSS